MLGGSFLSFAASLQYRADRVPSSCHERPPSSSTPSRSREIRRRLTAEGSRALRSVRENCHHRPWLGGRGPPFWMAFGSFGLTALFWVALVVPRTGRTVEPRGCLGSLGPSHG